MSENEPAGMSPGGVGRPESWIFLTGDPASVELPPSTLDEAGRQGPRSKVGLALAVVGVIVLYIWDDLLLAAPIIAVAGWKGAWPAFFIFTVLYGLGSFVIAMIAVRGYESYSSGKPSALAKFIEVQTSGRRGRFANRLVDGGKFIGFFVSSIALGAIATTWLIRYAGRSTGIVRVAALSSLIFGVSFVAGYAGIAALIF